MPNVACQSPSLAAQDGKADSAADASTDANESRFLAALQRMMGGAELTDEGVRQAIGKLTPKQRQELIMEGQGLKRDLLTKEEHSTERSLYFQEVSRTADDAGMPVDKDGLFLAKKVREACARMNRCLHLSCSRLDCHAYHRARESAT